MPKTAQRLLAAALFALTVSVPAFAADDVYDPLEPVNRYIFAFNDGLDVVFIRPITEIYHFMLPQYAQDRVHHALMNLDEPLSTVNYLLQGHPGDSMQSAIRFLVNTTFGIGGLYDVTGEQSADKSTGFGDTFARWGIGAGPYLVLPLVGPSDFRAATGLVADYYGDPVSITVRSMPDTFHHPETVLDVKYAVSVLDTRSRLLKQIDDLRKNSLDFYATARSIYLQRRDARLGQDGKATAAPDFN